MDSQFLKADGLDVVGKTARLFLCLTAPLRVSLQTGASPMYVACQLGHTESARLLMDRHADIEARTMVRNRASTYTTRRALTKRLPTHITLHVQGLASQVLYRIAAE